MRETLDPRRPWDGRRVVLGITGGIAAYKCVQVARDLTRLGASVDVVMTAAAARFVGPLSFQGVTGRRVFTDLWDLVADGAAHAAAPHIELGRHADAVCVAPATADLLARAAQGRADDLLTTLLLVTRAPVLLCPAMNDRMFAHAQVQANLLHLRDQLGYWMVGPDEGPLAERPLVEGEEDGPGRMVEPARIIDEIGRALGRDPAFEGRSVLVTAGPTREAVDPVRYVGNRSSGRMGYALAAAAWRRGAEVTLVSGPTERPDPTGVRVVRVEDAREMEAAVREHLPAADFTVFSAAVADYRPVDASDRKVKRAGQGGSWTLDLTSNPDVALDTRDVRKPGSVVVGFALETEDLVENARRKMESKGFDVMAANAIGDDSGFGTSTNRVTVLWAGGSEELPLLSKLEVAERLLDRASALGDAVQEDEGG